MNTGITPCPSALVRCAPVAFPVNKLAEIVFPVPNYVPPLPRPIHKKVFYPGHKEVLSPVIFGKIGEPHDI